MRQFSVWAEASIDRRTGVTLLSLSLIALHLTLLWRIGLQLDDWVLNGVFWVALLPKFHRKLWQFKDGTTAIADGIGFAIVVCLLLRCLSFYWFEPSFARLMPFAIVLGIGLFSAGRKVYCFWPEFLLIVPLAIPRTLLTTWLSGGVGEPLQVVTAQIAAFGLHYLGFVVSVQQSVIQLPQGSVDVELACTVFPSLVALFQLSIFFGVIWPLGWHRQVLVLGLSSTLAGIISILRVAVLALVVNHPTWFDFWHEDPGRQIVSTGLILAMVAIHRYFYRELEADGNSDGSVHAH